MSGGTEKPLGRILIVEDDPFLLQQLTWALKGRFTVSSARDATEGRALCESEPDLYVFDMRLPPSNELEEGLELLRYARRRDPEATVVMMSGEGEREHALRALALGAFDFFQKPMDTSELLVILQRALERRRLLAENRELRQAARPAPGFEQLVGKSAPMLAPLPGHREGRGQRRLGPDLGRERYGQGARRALGPRREPPARSGLRRRQRLGAAGVAGRSRALRAREGRVHRCDRVPAGAVRAGARRHPLPRRDRHPVSGGPVQAPAGPREPRDRAGRRTAVDPGRLPPHLGDQRKPGGAGRRRELSRGPVLPDPHGPDRDPAAARAGRRHSPPRRALPLPLLRAPRETGKEAFGRSPGAARGASLERQRPGAPACRRDAGPLLRGRRDPARRTCRGRCASRPLARSGRPLPRRGFAAAVEEFERRLLTEAIAASKRRQGGGGKAAGPGREPDQVPVPEVRFVALHHFGGQVFILST